LKRQTQRRNHFGSPSRPSRARGLKHCFQNGSLLLHPSRPSRARGLKLAELAKKPANYRRAPRGRVD